MTSLKDFREAVGYPQQDNNFSDRFLLTGGLNIETPEASGNPGELIYCSNYEPNFEGGYRSKGGLEPVDGQVQPSAFVYQAVIVTVSDPTKLPVVGARCSFVGLSANGYFLGNETINGTLYFIFTCCLSALMTSNYDNLGDNILRGTIPAGTTIASGAGNFGTTSAAATFLTDISRAYYYITLARTTMRNLIKPVGGASCSGAALGVFDWNQSSSGHGNLFALRNNLGGSQATLWVATNDAGWAQVNLGFILYYTTNTVQINVGDILTGATSGASATVLNVINMFGTVGGGDAIGYISGKSTSGTFVANEVLKVGGTAVAKTPASGNVLVLNTLPAGGNYRFRRWNFSGASNNLRLYGVNGVGTAFELSNFTAAPGAAVCLTPLITGVGLTAATFNTTPTTDKPTKLATWQDQLFLGYADGNLMHSGYQTPTNWTAVKGADDRTLGEAVTNMVEDVNNAMLITTRNRVRMLYGDVNENFQLRDLDTSFGAYADCASRIGGTTMLTDEGVQFYDQAVQFGNFTGSTISQQINSLLQNLLRSGKGVIESVVSRADNLYRLIFDGGIGLSFCINGGKCTGIGLISYGQNVHNFWSAPSTISISDVVSATPGEKIYCCGDDGYVYQDDTGGTFGAAGNAIVTGLQTQFYYGQNDIDKLKYYRRARVDVLGADAFTNLQCGAEYDDGYGYRTPEVFETVTRNLTAALFDQNSVYGISLWGGSGKNVLHKELHNSGVALSVILGSSSTIAGRHTLQAIRVDRAMRASRGWR